MRRIRFCTHAPAKWPLCAIYFTHIFRRENWTARCACEASDAEAQHRARKYQSHLRKNAKGLEDIDHQRPPEFRIVAPGQSPVHLSIPSKWACGLSSIPAASWVWEQEDKSSRPTDRCTTQGTGHFWQYDIAPILFGFPSRHHASISAPIPRSANIRHTLLEPCHHLPSRWHIARRSCGWFNPNSV